MELAPVVLLLCCSFFGVAVVLLFHHLLAPLEDWSKLIHPLDALASGYPGQHLEESLEESRVIEDTRPMLKVGSLKMTVWFGLPPVNGLSLLKEGYGG